MDLYIIALIQLVIWLIAERVNKMKDEIYTEDLVDFGSRERSIASNLLALPLPSGFCDDSVRLAMNKNSGFVFLVNSDYQCAMLNSVTGKLELWHSTPYNGYEGFLTDLLNEYTPDSLNSDDVEYLVQCAENEGVELPQTWKGAENENSK